MDFFPVTWSAGDTGPGDTFRITAYGKLPDGQSACVHIRFTPYFFVEMPREWSEARGRLFLAETCRKHDCIQARSQLVTRKSVWGFQNGRQQLFAQLAFESLESCKRARYRLKSEGRQTYEASVDPIVRLFHLRGIGPCQWLRVTAFTAPAHLEADVDREIECLFTAVGPSARTTRPPLVLASWDIEAYSASGRFPVADNPDDKLIQIATAFQRYGEAEPYHRAVVCLGDTDDVEGAEILSTAREHHVIDAWAQLLRDHKTDVLVGYNTHQYVSRQNLRVLCPRDSRILPRCARLTLSPTVVHGTPEYREIRCP